MGGAGTGSLMITPNISDRRSIGGAKEHMKLDKNWEPIMKWRFCIALLAAMIVSPAYADCDVRSFRDEINYRESVTNYLAYLSIIDESEYSVTNKAHKIDVGAIGSFGKIDGSSDYSELRLKRKELYKEIRYENDYETNVAYIANMLTDNGLKAYRACLLQGGEGISVDIVRASDEFVEVLINYSRGVSDPVAIDVDVDLRGVVNSRNEIRKSIKDANPMTLEFERERDADDVAP